MNEVTKFEFNNNEFRTVTDGEGTVWFVAKDVCSILGLDNNREALVKVPEKHKGVRRIDTLGGAQQMLTVDEAGLYRLILRSNKPEAEPVMEWVTSEVLPSIRKTGSYTMDRSVAIMSDNYEFTRNQLRNANSENKRLKATVLAQTPYWGKIKRCKDMQLTNAETARVICKSTRFVSVTLKKMADLGITPESVSFRMMLLEGEIQSYRHEREKFKQLYPEQYEQIKQRRLDQEGGAE